MDDVSRFQGIQQANAHKAMQAKVMEVESLRRIVVWLANAIQREGAGINFGPDGSLVIPKAEMDAIPSTYTLDTPLVEMRAETPCEACGAYSEGCVECEAATDAAPMENLVALVVQKKEGDGNGLIRPQGPGLVLP